MNSERVNQARALAFDYPGIDKLVGMNQAEITRETSWFPGVFVRVCGLSSAIDPACNYCGLEFGDWVNEIYIAIAIGGNYEIEPTAGHNGGAGVYCPECVERFKRWHRAVNLLVGVEPKPELRVERYTWLWSFRPG